MESIVEVLQSGSYTLIDVREDYEYRMGHIVGALNLPASSFPMNLGSIKAISGLKILYCRSGARSAQLANYLKNNGISNLYNGGGMEDLQHILDQE